MDFWHNFTFFITFPICNFVITYENVYGTYTVGIIHKLCNIFYVVIAINFKKGKLYRRNIFMFFL